MNLKKIFLLNIFIFLIVISAFSVFGFSCDVSKSPTTLYPAYDFYFEGKSARVTVFGEANGENFNYDTKVIVDCNINNNQPRPLEKYVTARIIAFTQSTLAYSSYCYYPQSASDVEYKIGAVLMPNNFQCINTDESPIFSKGNNLIKPTPVINPNPVITPPPMQTVTCGSAYQNPCNGKCNEPYVINSDGKCSACLKDEKYSEGICKTVINKDEEKDKIKTPTKSFDDQNKFEIDTSQASKELRFGIDWKWSLIGVPYGEISSVDNSCLSKIYSYDKTSGKYQKVTDLKDKNLIGKGLWAKRSTTGVGGCTLKYTGSFLSSQIINLKKGWNLIGVQTERSLDISKITSCKIISGPYMYSGFILNGKPQGYFKRENLNYGTGYWVKVEEDCKIFAGEEEETPPALPE